MDLTQLIEGAVKHKASDIHLMEDYPPYFRIDGTIFPIKHPPVTHEQIMNVYDTIVPDRLKDRLEEERGVDVGYQHKDLVRCRVIAFFERHKLNIVMRLVPLEVPTIEQMGLPTILEKISDTPRGLIMVTGPTSSGKTTTLATMINYLNTNKKISIITIEDPIEFYHKNKKAIVTQRQVGDDIEDFSSGVIQGLRQDPDVILLGEMRDLDTMRTAIKAAETGLLVLSTLHTTNAIQTIERIIAHFPETEHELVREQLASNMAAVVTQNLVGRIEGKGRIAAVEIMIVTKTVSKLITDNRMNDIAEIMKSGEEGMQVFDQALAGLIREKKISEETAQRYARDPYALRRYIQGVQSSSDRGGIIGGFAAQT